MRATPNFDDRTAAQTALATIPGGVLVGREVSPWVEVVDPLPRGDYDGRMDPIVDRLIADENETIRRALVDGRTIAVTKMDKPAERTAHRVGCGYLTDVLDRRKAWSPINRTRLRDDHKYSPALPTFLTREDAARQQLHECKTCQPGLTGAPAPTRSLNAEGLSDRHIGLTLVTEGGTPQGIIRAIDHHHSETTQRWSSDSVTIATDDSSYSFAGKDRVHVQHAGDHKGTAEREQAIRQLVGAL